MKLIAKQFILTLAIVGLVGTTVAFAGDSLRMRARMRADASAGDISGKADYREKENGRRRFSIEVEGFRPGTTLDVVVSGVKVGSVRIDNLGVGELEFDTNIEFNDDEVNPFPAEFPNIEPGDEVTVGQLSGTFRVKKRN